MRNDIVTILLRLRNKWLLHDPDRFHSINIETASKCNRRCGYCPVTTNPREDVMMPRHKVYALLDELRNMRYIGALHWGFYNEPLMDERLFDFVDYGYSTLRWCPQTVYTNGDMLLRGRPSWLVQRCRLVISDHGNSATWLPGVLRLSEHERHNIKISCPTVDTVTSRGGSVKSQTPLLRRLCDPTFIFIAADGYAPICCNDYNYMRREDWNVGKLGIRQVWANMYCVRRGILGDGVIPPDICFRCTENRVRVLSFEDWLKQNERKVATSKEDADHDRMDRPI